VGNAEELLRVADSLDDAALDAMGRKGVQFVASHRGATDKAMGVIRVVLG